MYDILIIHPKAGIFDAKADLVADPSKTGWSFDGKAVVMTDDHECHKILCLYLNSDWHKPRYYKSEIVGPTFRLRGVWGTTKTHNNVEVTYDVMYSTPRSDISDLALISKFVMDVFAPNGKYQYDYAEDHEIGKGVVVHAKRSQSIIFWEKGQVYFRGVGTYAAKTHIADPNVADMAKAFISSGIR